MRGLRRRRMDRQTRRASGRRRRRITKQAPHPGIWRRWKRGRNCWKRRRRITRGCRRRKRTNQQSRRLQGSEKKKEKDNAETLRAQGFAEELAIHEQGSADGLPICSA